MKHLVAVLIIMLLFTATSEPLAIAAPELTLGSATVQPGGVASLSLSLSQGSEQYAGMNAKIILPKGLTVKSISKGALLSANFIIDFRSFSETANNGATLIAYSGSDEFSASSGVLLTLTIEVAATAATGQYDIKFASTNLISRVNSRYALANKNAASVAPLPVNGKITISLSQDADNDGLPDWFEQKIIDANPNDSIKTFADVKPEGDFDGDGQTNLAEYQKGCDPVFRKGDIDKDGKISPQDAVDVFRLSSKTSWTSDELCNADYDGDGAVTPQDAVDIFWASF